jgi:hypothetical protein
MSPRQRSMTKNMPIRQKSLVESLVDEEEDEDNAIAVFEDSLAGFSEEVRTVRMKGADSTASPRIGIIHEEVDKESGEELRRTTSTEKAR